jgi:hypothetical protein
MIGKEHVSYNTKDVDIIKRTPAAISNYTTNKFRNSVQQNISTCKKIVEHIDKLRPN